MQDKWAGRPSVAVQAVQANRVFDLQQICLPRRLSMAEKRSSHLAQAEHQNDDSIGLRALYTFRSLSQFTQPALQSL